MDQTPTDKPYKAEFIKACEALGLAPKVYSNEYGAIVNSALFYVFIMFHPGIVDKDAMFGRIGVSSGFPKPTPEAALMAARWTNLKAGNCAKVLMFIINELKIAIPDGDVTRSSFLTELMGPVFKLYAISEISKQTNAVKRSVFWFLTLATLGDWHSALVSSMASTHKPTNMISYQVEDVHRRTGEILVNGAKILGIGVPMLCEYAMMLFWANSYRHDSRVINTIVSETVPTLGFRSFCESRSEFARLDDGVMGYDSAKKVSEDKAASKQLLAGIRSAADSGAEMGRVDGTPKIPAQGSVEIEDQAMLNPPCAFYDWSDDISGSVSQNVRACVNAIYYSAEARARVNEDGRLMFEQLFNEVTSGHDQTILKTLTIEKKVWIMACILLCKDFATTKDVINEFIPFELTPSEYVLFGNRMLASLEVVSCLLDIVCFDSLTAIRPVVPLALVQIRQLIPNPPPGQRIDPVFRLMHNQSCLLKLLLWCAMRWIMDPIGHVQKFEFMLTTAGGVSLTTSRKACSPIAEFAMQNRSIDPHLVIHLLSKLAICYGIVLQ